MGKFVDFSGANTRSNVHLHPNTNNLSASASLTARCDRHGANTRSNVYFHPTTNNLSASARLTARCDRHVKKWQTLFSKKRETQPFCPIKGDSSFKVELSLDEEKHTVGPVSRGWTTIELFDGRYEVEAHSLKYLKEGIKDQIERKHDVVKINVLRKKEFLKSYDHVRELIKYLDNYASLEKCLKRACDIESIVQTAEEKIEIQNYLRILGEDMQIHLQVQKEVAMELVLLMKEYDRKLKSAKRWRKIFHLGASIASALIPVIGAVLAMVAPIFVVAIVQGTTVFSASMVTWCDSFWGHKEKELKEQKDVINSMELKDDNGMQDLNTIASVIHQLQIELDSQSKSAHLNCRQEEVVNILGGFLKNTCDFHEQAERCCSYMENKRNAVLMKFVS